MKKRLLITPTGYFNTGSSAITHMLTEIEGVENSSGVYEMRILFDPDCISDLEYNLIENPHRQNTSFALQRFQTSSAVFLFKTPLYPKYFCNSR